MITKRYGLTSEPQWGATIGHGKNKKGNLLHRREKKHQV